MDKKELAPSVKREQELLVQVAHNIQELIDENTSINSAYSSDEYEVRQNLNVVKSSIETAIKHIKYTRAILEF